MTFSTREASRTLGEPVHLYFFRYGDTPSAYYAYTDAEQPVTFEFDIQQGPVVFLPVPITRGSITSSGALDKTDLEVRAQQDAGLAQLFTYHPPSQIVVLTIFQGHAEDDDYRVEWIGRVLGCAREENEAVFTCEPVSTSMKRPGLRRNYQYQCPHVLYGPQCKADREAASIVRTVGSVAGALVSWTGALDVPGDYIGGLAEWTTPDGRTELRTITKQADSSTFILSGVAIGLVAGATIKFSMGCDHKVDGDCASKFNNILNFGGQPWIPTKNPLGVQNNFY